MGLDTTYIVAASLKYGWLVRRACMYTCLGARVKSIAAPVVWALRAAPIAFMMKQELKPT